MSFKRLAKLEFDQSIQLSADLLLIDDSRAKKVAYLNNLEVMGSLDVLLLAKKKGLIARIKPSLVVYIVLMFSLVNIFWAMIGETEG